MKKRILLLATLPFFSFALMATAPTLPTKDLSNSPVIGATTLNYETGTRKMMTDNLFAPTGNYTVEVRAKILSAAVKGLLLELRDASRNGVRMSINSNGVDDYSALNQANETAITNISADANDVTTYHTFRFAIDGTNVHIYRDGVYVTTTTTQGIYKDNLLKDSNGNFESTDMSMWNFIDEGQGRTVNGGEFRNGSAGVKLVNTNTTSVVASLTIKGLKPNSTYAFSFYAKYLSKSVNNGNFKYDLKLGNYDGTGTFVRTNALDNNNGIIGSPTNTTDPGLSVWNANGKSFSTGATDSVAILDISGWNGSNTYVIDDMVLYEVDSTPIVGAPVGSNLVTNGDFATDKGVWPNGTWPLGTTVWSATNGGQLQIREASWVAASNGTYSVPVAVSPNKTYKLTATTSQRAAAVSPTVRSVKLADGFASVSTDYNVPTGSLTTYYTNTTPALTAGPASTSLTMQFTTRTNSSTGSPVTVMTLDDVILQEYEATFPSYLSYGKAYQSEAANFDIAYINYDLTGAYAPVNLSTNLSEVNNKLTVINSDGTLKISGVKAGEIIEVYNFVGIKISQMTAHDGENQLQLKNRGVMLVKSGNYTTKIIL